MLDVIIIGSGPAGLTAGIYLLRSGLTIKVFEKETIGGHITSSPLVSNYPGLKDVSGLSFADNLYEQFTSFGGEVELTQVLEIKNQEDFWEVITDDGIFTCKKVIIASGTNYRTLNLPKEKEFIGSGISFCVTCDGPFYKDKTVAVVGGGNSALIEAIELAKICQKVYVIALLDKLTGEKVNINKINELKNVEVILNSTVTEYIGQDELEKIKINDDYLLDVDGLFLAIGQDANVPNIKDLKLDANGFIETDINCETNQKGIYAIGDVKAKIVRQLTTATSDGTVAALAIIEALNK